MDVSPHLVDHVRARWASLDRVEGPPEIRIVEGPDRFLVALCRAGTGTVGRVVRYRDFCTQPGTSVRQVVDRLFDTYVTLIPWRV